MSRQAAGFSFATTASIRRIHGGALVEAQEQHCRPLYTCSGGEIVLAAEPRSTPHASGNNCGNESVKAGSLLYGWVEIVDENPALVSRLGGEKVEV